MVQKKLISANYNYNIQRMQDKALKRVNYVQIGYMMPVSLPSAVGNQMRGRMELNNNNQVQSSKKINNNVVNINNCNLPQIRNYNSNTKPISSDSKKRIYRWSSHLNGSMNNLTNNNSNNNNNLNSVNVNIISKNIPAPRNNNRAGSIQPLGKGMANMNVKQDYFGLQINNLTNDFSPSLNIEKLTPAKTTGKNFNSIKNPKKYK